MSGILRFGRGKSYLAGCGAILSSKWATSSIEPSARCVTNPDRRLNLRELQSRAGVSGYLFEVHRKGVFGASLELGPGAAASNPQSLHRTGMQALG